MMLLLPTTRPVAPAVTAIKIAPGRASFSAGEDVTLTVTIINLTAKELDAPSTYWAAKVILDGKEYKRLSEFSEAWNGAGTILAKRDFQTTLSLFEYGIQSPAIDGGMHKITVKIGDDISNELVLKVKPFVLKDAQQPIPCGPATLPAAGK